MTDPTADAAKLLPCPSVICPSHHPAWDAGIVAGLRDETSGYRVTCAECDAFTGYYAHAGEAIAAWNTRPQPAPPAGEPDWEQVIEQAFFVLSIKTLNRDEFRAELIALARHAYGLAARPKVEDAEIRRQIEEQKSFGHYKTAHLLEWLAGEREGALLALSEREAELANARAALVAAYEGCPDEHLNDAGFASVVKEARKCHAGRQQQAEPSEQTEREANNG